jgi:hypothetical protein
MVVMNIPSQEIFHAGDDQKGKPSQQKKEKQRAGPELLGEAKKNGGQVIIEVPKKYLHQCGELAGCRSTQQGHALVSLGTHPWGG